MMKSEERIFGKLRPETQEETNLRVCATVAEHEGNYKLAREFRYASSKDALSPKARKFYDREVGVVVIE